MNDTPAAAAKTTTGPDQINATVSLLSAPTDGYPSGRPPRFRVCLLAIVLALAFGLLSLSHALPATPGWGLAIACVFIATIAWTISAIFRRLESEHQQTEALSQRLSDIISSSFDAIITKSLDGIITSWNPGAESLFGFTAREAIGMPMSIVIPAERRSEEPAILSRIAHGERINHFDTVRIAKDGRRVDVSVTISPIRDRTGVAIHSRHGQGTTVTVTLQGNLAEPRPAPSQVAFSKLDLG